MYNHSPVWEVSLVWSCKQMHHSTASSPLLMHTHCWKGCRFRIISAVAALIRIVHTRVINMSVMTLAHIS